MASFMSGMAGNVSAFNTVFTYDIYQSYINPNKSDNHYLNVGRWTTVIGVLISVMTAYVARSFNNVMDFLQLIFAFINAPLFAAFLLGMFWKRTTGHAAFWGLIGGTISAALHHGLTLPKDAVVGVKGGYYAILHTYPSEMAQNFWTALYAFTAALILTLVITLLTKRLKTDEDLKGLVYSLTPKIQDDSKQWYQKPGFLAIIVGALALTLSIIFW
jgi:SSS family solute:Na+ symporter